VGSPLSFSASIQEYCDLLDKEIHDFVIITEMLALPRDRQPPLFSDFAPGYHVTTTIRPNPTRSNSMKAICAASSVRCVRSISAIFR
jgi:hypothetical protein